VPPLVCDNLRPALSSALVPGNAEEAEATIARIVATVVPKFARARVGEDGKVAPGQTPGGLRRGGAC
jgi:hypothetical protein